MHSYLKNVIVEGQNVAHVAEYLCSVEEALGLTSSTANTGHGCSVNLKGTY